MKIIRFWNNATMLIIVVLLTLALTTGCSNHSSYSSSIAYLEKIGDIEMVSKDNSFTNGFGELVITKHYSVYYFDYNRIIDTEEGQCLAKLAKRYTVFYNLQSENTFE
jgi:hypothetical protein